MTCEAQDLDEELSGEARDGCEGVDPLADAVFVEGELGDK